MNVTVSPLLQLFGEFEPFGFEIIAFSIDGGELFIELVETLVVARVMGGHLRLEIGLLLFKQRAYVRWHSRAWMPRGRPCR